MTTKLTLSVEKRVIQKAKRYAKTHKKSLSEIVTNYLDYISTQGDELSDIDPDVLKASGHISSEKASDVQELKYRYLRDKYLNE